MTRHPTLTLARWRAFPLVQRVRMVGTELKRFQHWEAAGDARTARSCAERALELLDLTIETARKGRQRRELCRAREVLRGTLVSPAATAQIRLLTRALIGNL